ncbi:lipopolysaccharide biosynthesis protein [Aliarcobacter cryaerophilus]|uniref:lipopolysaccharide biosynthesis protein n=1 Tax=Aliarcobacter cryaerophilus TaxID=28198 RepID=UPI0008253D53|nr:oligosaccharide flippase family protein [Aliarcobacter cryaerophilus]
MFKNSFIFILFEIINKAIPFLLLPVLTRYLTPYDYGIIASFLGLVSFLVIFIGLNGHSAININYFKLDKEKLGVYIVNVLLILIFTTFLCLVIILILSNFIENKLAITLEWQILAVITALGQFITLVNLSLWIVEQKPVQFGLYQSFQTILITLISIILVVGYSFNWQGQLLAIVIGTLVLSFSSIIVLYKRGLLNLKIEKLYIKDFIKFGIPLVPHDFGAWLRTQGDRFIIIYFVGVGATGLFSVGQQMGVIMNVLTSSINKALSPILYKILSNEITYETKRNIVKVSYFLFLGIVFVGFTLIFLLQLIYPYLLGKEFQDSLFLTQLIILGFIFEGFYFVVVNYIFYFKKTSSLSKITFSISILHIVLSFILVGLFGAIGAGYAFLISGMVQFISIWYLSNKVYSMPWFSFWRKNELR